MVRPLLHPGYVAGRWYCGLNQQTPGSAARANGSLYATPFFIEQGITISDLAMVVQTLAVGGKIQLGIYASDPATKMPTGAPLAVTGDLSTTLLAAVSGDITGADVALSPGLYWFGMMVDATAAATVTVNTQGIGCHGLALIGSTTLTDLNQSPSSQKLYFTLTGLTYGTWPASPGLVVSASGGALGPMPYFKVASVTGD